MIFIYCAKKFFRKPENKIAIVQARMIMPANNEKINYFTGEYNEDKRNK